MSGDFWQDRRVFVTGCSGLLGSWLTADLNIRGASVIGLIRDRVARTELVRSGSIDKINVVHGDVCDYALMERTMAEYEIDTVFHLAAQTIVGIANRAPLSTFETNIKGSWVVLEAARRNPTVKRVIVASSDQAYDANAPLPFHEDVPMQGRHPYGVSKSCADLIARAYAHTYDLSVGITRCANLFGGGDLNWNRIVPGTMRSVLRDQRPVVRSDGSLKRDYIYVHDAVCGYLMLAEAAEKEEVRGQAFNFGHDRPISVLHMINSIIEISDHPDLKPLILNEAQHESQEQFLSSDKASLLLGWNPQYSLKRGLEETMSWYREFLG